MAAVLVVDDDPDIRLLLRLELEAEGHDVTVASDGVEALEMIGQASPEVVLLDVMMPRLDGWGVLERLDQGGPAVVIVSGLATDHDVHIAHALELGALEFVSKPFHPPALLAVVAEAARLAPAERDDYRRRRLAEVRDQSD